MGAPHDGKVDIDDLKIEGWEHVPIDQQVGLRRVLTELRHADIAIWVATLSLAMIGASSTGVLIAAFAYNRDPPAWANAAVSAIIAAAIALVFNNRSSK